MKIELIKDIAPTLAAALDGPFVSIASKFIIDNLGSGDIYESIDELLHNTENLKKIKVLDEQFKLEMKELGINVYAFKTVKETENKKIVRRNFLPQIILSVIFIITYFILIAAVFVVEVSDTLNMQTGENSLHGEFQILLGVLTAAIVQILAYWFGDSSSSKTMERTD